MIIPLCYCTYGVCVALIGVCNLAKNPAPEFLYVVFSHDATDLSFFIIRFDKDRDHKHIFSLSN